MVDGGQTAWGREERKKTKKKNIEDSFLIVLSLEHTHN